MSKIHQFILAALAMTATAPLLACDGASEPATSNSVSISADQLAALPDGEAYVVDGSAALTHLDPSAGPLDLSRVALQLGDQQVSLAEALRAAPELQGINVDDLDSADISIGEAADQTSFRQAEAELEPEIGCVSVRTCISDICVTVTVCV